MSEELKKDELNPDVVDESVSAKTEEPVEQIDTDKEECLMRLAQSEQQLLRLRADFDNFRRRTREEKAELTLAVQADLITSLLPILDNFERALDHPVESEGERAFMDGMALILRQLRSKLKEYGVEEIAAMGEILDPFYHEAISRVPNNECREDEILQVAEKGYKIGTKVLRPAKVVVAYSDKNEGGI